MFGFYGAGLDLFSLMFTIVFIMVMCVFIFTIAKGLSQWNRNNHSPRLSVPARIITKRQEVHHHHHDNHMSSSTSYYVTFQVESGDRLELSVNGWEYGQLAEEDFGKLTFQGTRYLGFERQ